MLPHSLGYFNFHSLLWWSFAYSLNAVSCPWQFQFIFPAPVVSHILLECHLTPLAISISIPCSGGHSHIPCMLSHALGNFNLHSPLLRPLTHSLNAVSCPRQFQFIFPTPVVNYILLECHLTPLAISISIPCSGGHPHIP